QVFPEATGDEPDVGELVDAGVRAAVVCPERESERWFSWKWRWEDDLIDRLVEGGRLVRPAPGGLGGGGSVSFVPRTPLPSLRSSRSTAWQPRPGSCTR